MTEVLVVFSLKVLRFFEKRRKCKVNEIEKQCQIGKSILETNTNSGNAKFEKMTKRKNNEIEKNCQREKVF